MPKSFIARISAWRFERPLAIALAASAVFAVMAAPPAALALFPGAQPLLALAAGILLGTLGYVAMTHRWSRPAPAEPDADETAIPEDEQSQFAAAEVSLRLRRADRHPDAPVRAPIFASRDLGSPFMEVGAFASPPAKVSAGSEIADADYAEIETPPAPVAEEHQEPAPIEPVAAPPIAVVAPEPELEPEPEPARPERESIAAMMERLSAGLERRAAHGAAMPPPAATPALREALDELNRLAVRRG